jgi:hypothetical protein
LVIFLIAGAATSRCPLMHNALAAGREQWVHKDDDGDNTNEDFEEQNSIQICCAWGLQSCRWNINILYIQRGLKRAAG